MTFAQTITFERSDARFGFEPHRACALCKYGQSGACDRPEVRGQGQPVTFEQARRSHGACGPEAYYLNFPGLYRPGEAP